MVHMEAWLNKVDEIAAEGPSYKLGHDGSDGTCDCIGAIRRAGGKWTGTNGSNWAARNAIVSIGPADETTIRPVAWCTRCAAYVIRN